MEQAQGSDRKVTFEENRPHSKLASRVMMCYNCQQEGHTSQFCRAPCGQCQKLGHISGDCPDHPRNNSKQTMICIIVLVDWFFIHVSEAIHFIDFFPHFCTEERMTLHV
jgi:hypothetical protein